MTKIGSMYKSMLIWLNACAGADFLVSYLVQKFEKITKRQKREELVVILVFFLKVFLIETDGRLFVWIGKDASSKEKQNAMSYAQVSDEATFNCHRIKSWNVWKGSYHECQRADFLLRHLYDILSTDCLHCWTSRFSICWSERTCVCSISNDFITIIL